MTTPARRRAFVACLMLSSFATFPLSGHAQDRQRQGTPPPVPETATEPQGFLPEPEPVERAAIFMDRHFAGGDTGNGFYVDFDNMVSGAGWLSGGPGYRRWFARDSVLVDGSASISSNGYTTAQARLELPRLARSRLALGTQFKWQNFRRVDYFGEGPDSSALNESQYHLQSKNLVGYATVRPAKWLGINGEVGWLQPTLVSSIFGAPAQPDFLHTEASVIADTRDFPGHPTRGGLFRAAAGNFSDRDTGAFSFNRYEAEAAHFIPLFGSRLVVGTRGWLVATDTGEGSVVPFYLLPSLGGHNSLRGYDSYRFHDRNLLLLNVETRAALMTHIDAAFFVDAGNVAARVSDLDFDKRSYGAGLRFHSRRETFARFDVARSSEGWRFLFRLNDPLKLSRLARRTAPIPFVP